MEHRENTDQCKSANGREIFTPAEAADAFGPEFLDLECCRGWILNRIHKGEARCPGCGSSIQDEQRLFRFWSGKRLSCPACGKKFTSLTGTFLSGSHMDYRGLFLLFVSFGRGWETTETARRIGCDPATVRNWRKKIEGMK
ncbi:IS1 family transposase [Desulfoluna butyratoxydans]|uniref:Uncharacterized protein n=1 Tax=Desulfoluna butyratoxydans TaxID=231438 RepID=A0A4U8YSK5_9BACT|nr:IS1 family transposase [Desulfoluna butyratoxydans]VFQ46891.1 hypothetical protein MSL71_45730 [Desulfoluna butyratoxydans]